MKIQATQRPGTTAVDIVASGFTSNDTKNFNVLIDLDGAEKGIVNFVARGENMSVTPNVIDCDFLREVTLTVNGATGDIIVTCDNPNIRFDIDQAHHTITVRSDSEQTGKLIIQGQSQQVAVPVNFTRPNLIPATITPKSRKMTKDKTFNVRVILDQPVNAHMASGANMEVTPSSGRTFTVRCLNDIAGTDTLVLSKPGYRNNEIELTFRDQDEITHMISKNQVETGTEIFITVLGLEEGRELIATSSDPRAKLTVDGNIVKVNASEEVTATITVKGRGISEPFVPQFTEEVVFTMPKENINVKVVPASGYVTKGGNITLTVTGATGVVNAASSEPKITVSPSGVDKQWTVTATERCEGDITFTGDGINEKVVKVFFTETAQPQFYLDSNDITIQEAQMPFAITVKELVGDLKIKNSNPIVFKPILKGNVITLGYVNPSFDLKVEEKIKLVLSVPGQRNVTANVTLVPTPELPSMPCDGEIITGYPDESIYFNAPTKDSDDVIQATCDDPAIQIQVQDVNRVYVNTSKNAPVGEYVINVTHSEFKPAKVIYKCIAKPVIVQPDGRPVEYYDLGAAPKVQITTNPNDYIKDVFESRDITTDAGRISYVLENANGVYKSIANVFCSYNRDVGKSTPLPTDMEGGRMSRLVFDQFLEIFGTSDYYDFRNKLRLAIKVMKHYQENSFATLLMMRFESGWIGTREELALYRNIAAFLNKYIDANGQNVSCNGFEVTGDGFKNMERYCQENIQP